MSKNLILAFSKPHQRNFPCIRISSFETEVLRIIVAVVINQLLKYKL